MAESMVPTSAQQVKFCTTDKCSDMYHAAIRAAVADSGKKNLALAQCKALGGMGGFAKAFCAKDSNGAFCPYAGWSQTIDNLPAHKMLDSMDGNKAAPTQADMTLMCSECQMKTGPAWIQAMMNMGDDPAVSHPNDWSPSMEQQMKDMVSRMNAVACTKGSTGFEDSPGPFLPPRSQRYVWGAQRQHGEASGEPVLLDEERVSEEDRARTCRRPLRPHA